MHKWNELLDKISRVLHDKEHDQRIAADRPIHTPAERKQNVVGGDISRDPINRQAALLLRKANWLAQPPPIPLKPNEEKTETEKSKTISINKIRNEKAQQAHQAVPRNVQKAVARMEKHFMPRHQEITGGVEKPTPRNGEYISTHGIRIVMIEGEPHFDMESMRAFLLREIPELIPELNPAVQGAKDARTIIDELLHGIGGEMEQFKLKTKDFLNDIRQTRYSVTAETSQMMTALRDIRQFFIGADYAVEIERLREFVELCERLNKLKQSGFLDKVADTMLSLSLSKND